MSSGAQTALYSLDTLIPGNKTAKESTQPLTEMSTKNLPGR
jgi:hypothetical protein